MYVCSFTRVDFGLQNSFPEEECLVYWSLRKKMLIWGSAGLSLDDFLEPKSVRVLVLSFVH